ncbi:MAG: 3-phosphoshikimate 1-carboxyvinyltransferase [Verrucomicrobiae bacterium]|nr:3-phosphoshikimate 1-carboxyvinyltransferase [Verrucomicrobiae bacterium]
MITLPDILEIKPLKQPPHATITVPGSKSITNRALILAALADGKCTLRGALWADDTQVMVDSLQRLGFEVNVSPDPAEECNRIIEVIGCGGKIPAKKADLFVGNAGTAARFITAFVCLAHGEYKISGDPRMHERPMADLFEPLKSLGVDLDETGNHLPVTIHANGMRGGTVSVSARRSSQFASALMLISRWATLDIVVSEPDEQHGYIEMTRRMIEEFQPDYLIEPDLSSASYFLAINVVTGGQVVVAGWPRNSLQIDGRFPLYVPPPRIVSRLSDLGDSVMTLAICALFFKQPMQLTRAERMRVQECDRLHAMVNELGKVGVCIKEHQDGFTVFPGYLGELHGADIETYNDHRMAMCFSVLGLKIPGIRIKNPSCVSKTFPNFFDKLKQLGAELVDVKTGRPI